MKPRSMLMLLIACQLAFANASAESLVTEVIPLHYRSLNETVHTLRPLVPAPGTVTGLNNQLVVRTTPSNLKEIRAVLAELDHAPRRLLIQVKQGRWEGLGGYEAEATGAVRRGNVTFSTGEEARTGRGLNAGVQTDEAQANARVWGTRARDDEVGLQSIQTTEGREAFIRTGQSVPVGERTIGYGGIVDTVRYKDVSTGFYVTPRMTGDDRVSLEISPHSARLSPEGGGKIDFQAASTVVSGRLGEWILVGGSQEDGTFSGSATVYATRRNENINRTILLRVREMP